jgi:small conductance mechanosensitive channel
MSKFSDALRCFAILVSIALLPFAASFPTAVFAQSEQQETTQSTASTLAQIPSRCDFQHFGDCLQSMLDNANDALSNLMARLPQLLLAMIVVLSAYWFSRFVGNRLHLLRLRSRNPYMNGLLRTVVRSMIMLIAILIALDLVGLTGVVGAVLGSAGVIGLALGFAFRDIAENYIASVMLSVRRPFEPGDHVVIEGHEGKVVSIHSRATVLMTLDGNHLQLPNSMVFKSVVLNYSRNPKRRFDFEMLVDSTQSIRKSQTLAMSAIAEIEGVLDDPAPSWLVVNHDGTAITLRFYGWIDQRKSDFSKVRSESIRHVKAAFTHADILSPQTTYNIITSRSRDMTAHEPSLEPMHNGADTSVNRDIDAQIVEARAEDRKVDLLQASPSSP